MRMPAVQDTIVAVSSGWRATPAGIVRLSGRESFELVARLGVSPAASDPAKFPMCIDGRLQLRTGQTLPANAIWFRAPRSYTGQDVVELHTIGCLPLLRELTARLIELGARRALPGEFTTRALVTGRLDASQVEGVLSLMWSHQGAELRQAARLARGESSRLVAGIREGIVGLLARVEAGIDFAEEEDIRFITPSELARSLDDLIRQLGRVSSADADPRTGRPHVALAGLPNAGKSTLFNALVGHERALVSPVLGTTRDVLSCEVTIGDLPVVLQDCAGLGPSQGELELATHLAAEQATQQADLVLWVHAVDVTWDERETLACQRVPPDQRVLVHSKIDLRPASTPALTPIEFSDSVKTCANNGTGIELLRRAVGTRCQRLPGTVAAPHEGRYRAARAALLRARELTPTRDDESPPAELVSLELREANELLESGGSTTLDEELLDRIFTEFCVGK